MLVSAFERIVQRCQEEVNRATGLLIRKWNDIERTPPTTIVIEIVGVLFLKRAVLRPERAHHIGHAPAVSACQDFRSNFPQAREPPLTYYLTS